MKKAILTTAILLSSITLFTGCSETTPNAENKLAKERLSVYNIMGIKEPKKVAQPLFVVTKNQNSNHHFIKSDTKNYYNYNYHRNTSNNVEVVSYGSYTPRVQQDIQTKINNIEWNAKSFLGTRYVWGATGPSKFDCSGFTQWIYRDAGISIPRVSRDQAKVGSYVRYDNLKKGDMVFFDTKKRKNGVVSHVGIYLGNGNFIHASSAAKKVVVYNFNQKTFYKKRFLWGRRVIHENMRYASN